MNARLEAAADLVRKGRWAEARSKLLKELRFAPDSIGALALLGTVLSELGKHDEAIALLRRAAHLAPSSPGPRLNLGKALIVAGRVDEAADTLAQAVRRWPKIPEAWLSYGNALLGQGNQVQAIARYREAVRLDPRSISANANLALVLCNCKDYEAALPVCENLLHLDANSAAGQLAMTMAQQNVCDWRGHDARVASLAKLVEQGHIALGMPLLSMSLWDDVRLHRRCAEVLTQQLTAQKKLPPPRHLVRKHERVRVAYVSADFRAHVVATLIAGVIEDHDRDRFEIVGVSYGIDDNSAMRRRLVEAFDRFLDVGLSTNDVIVQAMREMQIDIAVDLMGHTGIARPAIFVQRAAPIQVTYLGFPGTTAIDGMDYMVADPFVAAGELRVAATERLVILPDCYLCNDGKREIPVDLPTRSSCSLPGSAFVFCSFNDVRKLTPQVFDLWMRIMRQVEGSVLWLRRSTATAERNLCSEAERRGVDPTRLIFAERVDSHSLHLARNGVADLHLDTFPYNAHTTASEALWAGCPILTRAGNSFASRVCGSLLTTVGVPELITTNAEDYEALAVRLARDKPMLADLRRRIEHGRANSPLFDTPRFTRNLERAYEAMVECNRAGKPPAEIDVRSLGGVHSCP